jgi:hypothetical protein
VPMEAMNCDLPKATQENSDVPVKSRKVKTLVAGQGRSFELRYAQ